MPKKKLTLTQKQIIKSVKSIIGRTKDIRKIYSLLESRGYILVDSGGYKRVYRRDGEQYCVKVYRENTGWKFDSYEVPEHISKYYIHPIFINKKFMIQRWVSKAKRFNRKKVKKLPAALIKADSNDVCCDNIQYDGHKEVIIDFTYDKHY